MKRRSGAVHVARIVRKYKDREYVSFLLRRSYRDHGKIRHETFGHISALPEEAIKAVQATLAAPRLVAAADAFEITISLSDGRVAALSATARTPGLPALPCPGGPAR